MMGSMLLMLIMAYMLDCGDVIIACM